MKRMNRGEESASDGNTNVRVNYERDRARRTEKTYKPNAYPTGSVPEEDEYHNGYYANNSAPRGNNRITVCRVRR